MGRLGYYPSYFLQENRFSLRTALPSYRGGMPAVRERGFTRDNDCLARLGSVICWKFEGGEGGWVASGIGKGLGLRGI